ncbi:MULTISPECIES: extracellular solute-binding protein [Bacillaceae]|uniref:extracellular solute-binding protein n=1 Tax=Bacillaceae TaxID=186817 RepID=UPI0006AD87E9|nr:MULTISPECIES: extracellular solute-binding protein [Bacillaceae]ALC85906.1 ABC transporter substrate-binding protein [Bacillus sp. FJAT-22090]KQL35629.1 ABC transporter substrate-binding protein [Psychrobacillus sp. FJAT-21963]
MRKKHLIISFLILFLSFILVACSDETTEDGKETEKEKETATETEKNIEIDPFDHTEKYTITGMTFRFGDPPPVTSPGLDMINERFNVDYKPEIIPQGDYIEKSSAIVASGSMPDLVGFPGTDTRFYQWAEDGAFLPLDDYLAHYETLGNIPDYIYNSFKVDGKIYGIPRYSQPYPVTPVIRKDWLDKLGLEVPTNYKELEEVAIAFTKDDPDGNGKADTYGVAIGENINPNFNMGTYWDFNAWYHQNDNGDYIPGVISEGRKELIQFFANIYKEGAMTKDFAVLDWASTNTEFYSGKAGIFVGGVSGMSEAYFEGLLAANPDAKLVAIPPFEAPDKSKGFTMGSGYSGILALNAKLAEDEGKIYRALEMIDFGKKYYPRDEKNPQNEDYDFFLGKEGIGYNMENGAPVQVPTFSSDGLAPSTYFLDNREQVPTDAKINYADDYKLPELKEMTASLQEMFESNQLYVDPSYGVLSPTNQEKGTDLMQFLINEQSKMIAGQRPISDWDNLVDEYLKKGGEAIIKEVNEGIKAKGYTDREWK